MVQKQSFEHVHLSELVERLAVCIHRCRWNGATGSPSGAGILDTVLPLARILETELSEKLDADGWPQI